MRWKTTLRNNYVLIDYENVQPEVIEALDKEHFHVLVFVGANQTKVSFEIASLIQKLGERARYVKISSNGSNALDFHIAFYIGELASKEPDAFFHIISKDTGFDPLITHLKSRKIFSARHSSVLDIPITKTAKVLPTKDNQTSQEQLNQIITDLKRRGKSAPAKTPALKNTIKSIFKNSLNDQKINTLVNELIEKKLITVNQSKVTYNL